MSPGISSLERAILADLICARTRGIAALAIEAAQRLRAVSDYEVQARLAPAVVTAQLRDIAMFTRAAQDAQRAACDDAADAVDVIHDPGTSPEQKRAAWLDLQVFIGAELMIDLTAMPPSIKATSAPEYVSRIDVPDYYGSAARILRRRAWHDRRRVGWAKPYLKRAVLRDAHRTCVRELQGMREEDEIHADLDDLLAASDDDVSLEPVERAQADPLLAIGCERLLDTLRRSPRADDRELAADIEAWFAMGKTGMGDDARYQRMRYRLKKPRMRAMAQRLGFEPSPYLTASQINGRGERKQILLHGAGPLLPLGRHLPGWQSCYRTEGAVSRYVSPEWLVMMGYEIFAPTRR